MEVYNFASFNHKKMIVHEFRHFTYVLVETFRLYSPENSSMALVCSHRSSSCSHSNLTSHSSPIQNLELPSKRTNCLHTTSDNVKRSAEWILAYVRTYS